MNHDSEIYQNLENVFKYKSFKSSLQEEAVKMAVHGQQDLYVSMPTGAGKSLVYQLPAVIVSGVTIVISPLLALIQNQVESLLSLGIVAAALNSKLTAEERFKINTDLAKPNPTTKVLYITPEQLVTSGFSSILVTLVKQNNVAYFAVDEAHCVSEWGHDFRPDYLKLGNIRKKFSNIRWIALTATATPQVQCDIISSLQLHEPVAIFKNECHRPNLFYDLKFKELLDCANADLVEYVKSFLVPNRPSEPTAEKDCGIIYCRTRDSCEDMAMKLVESGIKAKAYHAGLRTAERNGVQQEWMDGVTLVIVATVSFGMGIDKAPVRFVIHWTVPQSVERYYQESGRAGRDGKRAYCRIYYSRHDREQIVFLLKKSANMKKNKARNGMKAIHKEHFKHLVQYCEQPRCRHAFIADYFGDKKPDCANGCDFCRNRKEVELMVELWRGGVIADKGMKGYSRTFVSTDFGKPDNSLYGDGRHGADTTYSDGEDQDDNDERKEKKYRKDLIQEQFKKRKGLQNTISTINPISSEVPARTCRLRQSANFTHIPRLSIKVREYCLGLLEKALILNYENNCRSSLNADHLAIDMEYDIFMANKSTQMYKLKTQQKVKEINQLTDREEIFFNCVNKDSPAKVEEKNDIKTKFSLNQFIKASELPSKTQTAGSHTETRPHSPTTCSIITSANGIIGYIADREQWELIESVNLASTATIDSSPVQSLQDDSTICDVTSSEETLKRTLSDENIQQMIAKTESITDRMLLDIDIPLLPPLPPLSSTYNSLPFVNKTDSLKSVHFHRDLPGDTQSTSVPLPTQMEFQLDDLTAQSSDKKLPEEDSKRIVTEKVHSPLDSCRNHAGIQPTVKVSHEHHPTKTSPGGTMPQSQRTLGHSRQNNIGEKKNNIGEKKNNKKDCANIIVKYLSPYYKSGEVKSKLMFKSLAREMTEKLVENLGNLSGEKLKTTAKSLVKMYFEERKRSSKIT